MAGLGAMSGANVKTLAEMLYMRMPASKEKPWGALEEKVRDMWEQIGLGVIEDLSKIGFEPRPLGEQQKARAALKVTKDQLTGFIRDYIAKNITVPKNLAAVFPCAELAIRIADKFTKPDNG